MGIQIHIEANTDQEWMALQSEGAPEISASHSTAATLFATFGIEVTDECGSFDPSTLVDRATDARAAAQFADRRSVLSTDGPVWMNVTAEHVETLIQMAEFAQRLNRRIVWG